MTLPEALELLQFWEHSPPENEILTMLARIYTTWEPKRSTSATEEERQAAHQASLEARWKAGAMNAKQLLEAMGGAPVAALDTNGVLQPAASMGIGPFPGMH